MIIDTHLHLIDRAALNYPWLADVPRLNQDFLYETYAREARRVGITAALHMEVDVAPNEILQETEVVGGLARRDNSLIKGLISACRPEDPAFPALVEELTDNSLAKGFRRVLHVVPDEVSTTALFRDNIRRLSGTRFTFDLCTLPHQIPIALELIDLAPDVHFILDHCGVPDIAGDGLAAWKPLVAEVARRPNVTAKISGVVAYAQEENWTVETLRPYVEHTITSFGWDRVVWGSDWPVCTLTSSLSNWVAATHALIAGATPDERAKLLSGNARRIWSLP